MSDLLQELIDYSNDVINNKITSCKKHKWACLRFLNDLKKNWEYVFDVEKAERFLNWMRLHKHTKGILSGQHIKPHIIQKFVGANIYGWVYRDTGIRRFTKAYWQVARKNAKSQFASCIADYECFAFSDKEEIMEVYCAATKKDQAKIVYNDCHEMLKRCTLLKGKWHESYNKLIHNKTGSWITTLTKEDKKRGDGYNPQCGIIDEYHAHETSEMYDIIDTGMGAREQPFLFIITTAGLNLNNPCYNVEYDLTTKILDPDNPVFLENYFVMINELEKDDRGNLVDDINEEKNWEKANPIICSYEQGVSKLRKDYEEAKLAPEKMTSFLTKRMNVWVNQREGGYMNLPKWNNCINEIPDLTDKVCFIGLDLSAKIDLTSVAFEFLVDNNYVVLSHSFMPEETFNEKKIVDKVPYDLWERQGWITVTPGAAVDHQFVIDWVLEKIKENKYYPELFCFDPWGALQMSNYLMMMGYKCEEIVQGPRTLSEPTKNFREMVYNGRVIHDNNPVLCWAISNAMAEEVDRNQNIILSKRRSTQRIDPIAAVLNAHVKCMEGEEQNYNNTPRRSLW